MLVFLGGRGENKSEALKSTTNTFVFSNMGLKRWTAQEIGGKMGTEDCTIVMNRYYAGKLS